jgi:hypothetical protein
MPEPGWDTAYLPLDALVGLWYPCTYGSPSALERAPRPDCCHYASAPQPTPKAALVDLRPPRSVVMLLHVCFVLNLLSSVLNGRGG